MTTAQDAIKQPPEERSKANTIGDLRGRYRTIKRDGPVKAQPIPAHDRLFIMRAIEGQHTREEALCYDEWQAYVALRLRGHVVIRKEKDRLWSRDHINGVEGSVVLAKN